MRMEKKCDVWYCKRTSQEVMNEAYDLSCYLLAQMAAGNVRSITICDL